MHWYRNPDGGLLWLADFTTKPSGAISGASLGPLLLGTRASGATVQTGTSSVVSGLGVDVFGVGRALDADSSGVVHEEGRTNIALQNRTLAQTPWSKNAGATYTANAGVAPDGGSTASRIQAPISVFAFFQGINQTTGTKYYSSEWVAAFAGTSAIECDFNTTFFKSPTTTAWTRIGNVQTAGSTGNLNFGACDTRGFSIPAQAQDNLIDLVQCEVGAYPSEAIVTTSAAATRAGSRIYTPYSAALTDLGRLELEITLQLKGATTDFSAAPYLWHYDASNFATISNSTGAATVVIGGASYTTASGVTWAQGDVLTIRIGAGGNVLKTIVKVSKNGGAFTLLGTSGAPQGNLPINAALDLLCSGTGNQLSSRIRTMRAFASGASQLW